MSKERFTLDDLKEILVDRIGLPESDIPDDLSTAFADIGMDSLAVVEVQVAVRQTYGLEIPDEDAGAMKTFRDALEYVNARLAAAGVA